MKLINLLSKLLLALVNRENDNLIQLKRALECEAKRIEVRSKTVSDTLESIGGIADLVDIVNEKLKLVD